MESSSPKSSRFQSRVNSLGLGASGLEKVLDAMDLKASLSSPRRFFVRWPFRKESVHLVVLRKGQGDQSLVLACRNISTQGMSLLHCAYLQPGSLCLVVIPGHEGRVINGRIVRCSHRAGMMHEIGIEFSVPIDLREYIPMNLQLKPGNLERVENASLRGVVVHFCESREERTLMRDRFRSSPLVFKGVADENSFVNQIALGCDAVLIEGTRQQVKDLTQAVHRESDAVVGAIAVTSVESKMLQLSISGLAGVLVRPFTNESICRFVAELLHIHRVSAMSGRGKKALEAMYRLGQKLNASACAGDLQACLAHCDAIGIVASEAGLEDVAVLASQVKSRLQRTDSLTREQLSGIAGPLISQVNSNDKWSAA